MEYAVLYSVQYIHALPVDEHSVRTAFGMFSIVLDTSNGVCVIFHSVSFFLDGVGTLEHEELIALKKHEEPANHVPD